MKRTLLVCLLLLGLVGCNKPTHGTQGQWIKQDDGEGQAYEVKVISSHYAYKSTGMRVLVYYQINNTGKMPFQVSWENKFLMDQEGRFFVATVGDGTHYIQPLSRTRTLEVSYDIPSGVDATNLSWCLLREGKPIYIIKLNPEKHQL
jgi:hypothetical protein